MVKTQSNFRRFIKLVFNPFLCLFFLIILNMLMITKIFCINKIKEQEMNIDKQSLSYIKEIYNEVINEKPIFEEKVNDLIDIDNKIVKIKEKYFKNALEYEKKVLAGEGTKKIAYLTIDDGPYKNYTPSFLNVLDKYDILSTFFLLGKPNEMYDEIYQRIFDSGHTIANHTYSHAIWGGLYASASSFINDVLKQEKFLEEKLGVKTNILRFPGGSTTASSSLRNSIITRLRSLNYGYVDWNVSAGDSEKKPNKEIVYNNVINGAKNKKVIVILMHDFSYHSLSALPSIIEQLQKMDFIFLPLFYESSKIKK